MSKDEKNASIAILGGTGKEGRGLALRFASCGRQVILGSREAEKGRKIAAELNEQLGSRGVDSAIAGESNEEAARRGNVIVSTVPYDGHLDTMKPLAELVEGKMVITATIRWPPGLDGNASAAEELDQALGGTARVVAAFQTVSAKALARLSPDHSEDVLVFADDPAARREAVALVAATGLRGVEAGPLQGARVAEALTGILLKVNKLYGVRSTGIRITGLPDGGSEA